MPDWLKPCGALVSSLTSRRLVAGERCLGVHRDGVVTADGSPPARRNAAEARVPGCVANHRRWRRRARCDWVEELAIDEHLRPDTGVDDVAAVLEELPVDVLRDGCAGLRRVNRDMDRRRLRDSDERERQRSQQQHRALQGGHFCSELHRLISPAAKANWLLLRGLCGYGCCVRFTRGSGMKQSATWTMQIAIRSVVMAPAR